MRVVFIAIPLTFTCNDALFHTNRPVRQDEGNCEIVRKEEQGICHPIFLTLFDRADEAWLDLTNFKDGLSLIDR